ncbi:Hypothetical predicted protein [Podarcis lilfordi]|uniref:Uncharacterized protein n=1 Tax=Podarcis lilfordi TaxID=74358 RepID=A0AA35KHN1_9SAUR|nr:Hypothetical predicted protein [Podarcis lilfordi]
MNAAVEHPIGSLGRRSRKARRGEGCSTQQHLAVRGWQERFRLSRARLLRPGRGSASLGALISARAGRQCGNSARRAPLLAESAGSLGALISSARAGPGMRLALRKKTGGSAARCSRESRESLGALISARRPSAYLASPQTARPSYLEVQHGSRRADLRVAMGARHAAAPQQRQCWGWALLHLFLQTPGEGHLFSSSAFWIGFILNKVIAAFLLLCLFLRKQHGKMNPSQHYGSE